MLANKSKLYKWTTKKVTYPQPYDALLLNNKRIVAEINGVPEDIGLIAGLISSAAALCEEELISSGEISSSEKGHEHMALGVSSLPSGAEEIYAEFTPKGSSYTQACCYNPETGMLLGCLKEDGQTITSALKFDGSARDIVTDCEAAWACLLIEARKEVPEVAELLEKLKKNIRSFRKGLTSSDPEFEPLDAGVDALAKLCLKMYHALSRDESIKLNLLETDTKFKKLNMLDIESGEVSPSKGKSIISSPFKIFLEGREAAKPFSPSTIDWDKYLKVPFIRSEADFTKAELERIPETDPNEAPSPVLIGILDEISRTWKKRDVLKTSRILLEGGSGSGKSYLARSIARHLRRPYATHICGSTDGPEEFQGIIVPYVKKDGKKYLAETPEMSEEKLKAYLANPSLLWPKDFEMDMLYNPDSAKEKANNLISSLSSMVKTALSKDKEESGVQYQYIPSSISAAIENGWCLEIQEPTCLIQQSALSCLFDVLDKGSIGYFKTPNGEIKRHPDFLCIVTQNRKYKGTKPLNEAARNRFTFIEKMEDPTKPVIESRLLASTGVKDMDLISQVTDLYLCLKEKAEDLNADGTVSFRNLQDFLDALGDNVDTKWAFERYLLNAITTDEEDQEELIEAVEDCKLLDGIYN